MTDSPAPTLKLNQLIDSFALDWSMLTVLFVWLIEPLPALMSPPIGAALASEDASATSAIHGRKRLGSGARSFAPRPLVLLSISRGLLFGNPHLHKDDTRPCDIPAAL